MCLWESDWDILGVGESSMNGGMGETPKIPHGYANLVNEPFVTLYPITFNEGNCFYGR